MFSMSKLREILQRAENAKIEKQNQEIKKIQDETDLTNEIANQAQNKLERSIESRNQDPNEKADNNIGSKGSVLSRLKTARMVIGTPNSDMGTGGDLGVFFKKELIN